MDTGTFPVPAAPPPAPEPPRRRRLPDISGRVARFSSALLPGLLLVTLGLAACATRADFEATLDTWVGATEKDLVTAWGPPERVYEIEGQRYLTWEKESTRAAYPPSSTFSVFSGGGGVGYGVGVGTGFPAVTTTSGCEITYLFEDGRARSWRWEGEDCW
jgi:hypothetical protein